MKKCNDCEKWFPEELLEDDQCIHCEEPWVDHSKALRGLDSPPPAWLDLLGKIELRMTRMDVVLPMPGDPRQKYIEATIYEDESRYWRIEGRSVKFKNRDEAIREVVQFADLRRLKQMNEAFEKEFGSL